MTRPRCSRAPRKGEAFTRRFGKAASGDAMFLLGSISKPINVTAVMTLFDQGKFQLDDRVKKFLPVFTGDGRDNVTVRHLLTHVSGLPDQLARNDELRKQHAPIEEPELQPPRPLSAQACARRRQKPAPVTPPLRLPLPGGAAAPVTAPPTP